MAACSHLMQKYSPCSDSHDGQAGEVPTTSRSGGGPHTPGTPPGGEVVHGSYKVRVRVRMCVYMVYIIIAIE